MKVLFHKKFLEHNIDSESEGAYRLLSFMDTYEAPRVLGEPYLSLVHSERYIEYIREACQQGDYVAEVSLNPASYEAACLAVGMTIRASEQGDFAVVRPPGHHAGRERAAGFCFFNNIAIAVQKLVNEERRFLFSILTAIMVMVPRRSFMTPMRSFIVRFTSIMPILLQGFRMKSGPGQALDLTTTFP